MHILKMSTNGYCISRSDASIVMVSHWLENTLYECSCHVDDNGMSCAFSVTATLRYCNINQMSGKILTAEDDCQAGQNSILHV